ncbi:MAG: PEP-CTERM sorting domain-containing protein [Verrucomicrobia bacterium]|nr:PEP-CTERM sorting domain-containing protein [Verrucomicrobiota bacterium]
MKRSYCSAPACALVLLVVACGVLSPSRAHAVFTFTLSQVGPDVVVTGSGTFITTGLTFSNNVNGTPGIAPSFGNLLVSPTGAQPFAVYSGITGPGSFGSGTGATESSGTGPDAGVNGSNHVLGLPVGYVSGTFFTDSATYNNATFASLGFTPGTYTYTWGSGATADSLTVTGVVPEPSSWAMVGAGTLMLLGLGRARRRALASRHCG